MRRFLVIGFSFMLVLGFVTSSHALILSEGLVATWEYDFSTDSIAPPYSGHRYVIEGKAPIGSSGWEVDVALGESLGGKDFFYVDKDLLLMSGGCGGVTTGKCTFENPNLNGLVVDSEVFYIQAYVRRGPVDILESSLAMNTLTGYNWGSYESTNVLEGRLISVRPPVPEPATMLLFGAGLVGLAGFGRKRFKK
jgi:hypothetical protein